MCSDVSKHQIMCSDVSKHQPVYSAMHWRYPEAKDTFTRNYWKKQALANNDSSVHEKQGANNEWCVCQ